MSYMQHDMVEIACLTKCMISIGPMEVIQHRGEMAVESLNMHATCRDIGIFRSQSKKNVDSLKYGLRNENNWR